MISVRGTLTYGKKTMEVDIAIEPARVTLLTGPNLTGKSLVLRCIYSRAYGTLGRFKREQIWQQLGELNCNVDEEVDLAIYLDAYRTSIQLYEYISHDFTQIKEIIETLKSSIREKETEEELEKLSRQIQDIYNVVKADHTLAFEAKGRSTDFLVKEAFELLDELRELYQSIAKEHELFDDFFPLLLSAEREGFTWRDLKTGASGRGLLQLSTVFAPALVAMFMIYSYGASEGRNVYLLVEEPEVHAHPVLAHFLGRFVAKLAEKAEERELGFHAIFATHSLDFLMGAYGKYSKVYILTRSSNKIYVQGTWDGRSYVPGLSDTSAYEIFTKS